MKVHNANATDDVPSTEVEEENKSVKCEEKSSGLTETGAGSKIWQAKKRKKVEERAK